MKTTPGNKVLTAKLLRKVDIYIKTSRAYNYDCNTRPEAKPGDAKRNKLFWKNWNSFDKMCESFKELNPTNLRVKCSPGRRRH